MKWEDRLERARAQREARLRSHSSSGVGESRVTQGRRPNTSIDAAREQRLGSRSQPENRMPAQRSQSLSIGQRLVFVGMAFCLGIGIGGGIILYQDRILEADTLAATSGPVVAALRDDAAAADDAGAGLAATDATEIEPSVPAPAESDTTLPVAVALAPPVDDTPETETVTTESAELEPVAPETSEPAPVLETAVADPVAEEPTATEEPTTTVAALSEEAPLALEELNPPLTLNEPRTDLDNAVLPALEELAERNAAANVEISLLGNTTDDLLPSLGKTAAPLDEEPVDAAGGAQPKIVDAISALVPASLDVAESAQLGTPGTSFGEAPRLAALSDGGPVLLARAPAPGVTPDADRLSPKRLIAGAAGMSIRIFATGSVAEDTVETARATVESYNLPLTSVNRVNYRISRNQVRYYDNSSAEAAALLAAELQAVARDFTNSPALAGTLEIYLAGEAITTPSARPVASAPVRRSAPRVDEATRLRNSVISRLRERMSQ